MKNIIASTPSISISCITGLDLINANITGLDLINASITGLDLINV